jgi:uncharacterized membrane protein YeaQ/YmgE (transglycosylase-associated protein family)
MPLLFGLLLVLFLVLAVVIFLTFQFSGLIITLLIAAIVGWIADAIVPGRLPYGWLGAIVAGLAGAWLGGLLLGDLGPEIGGIAIIPAIIGAMVIALLIDWIAKATAGRRTMP